MHWTLWRKTISQTDAFAPFLTYCTGVAPVAVARKVYYFLPTPLGVRVLVLSADDASWEEHRVPGRCQPLVGPYLCVVGVEGHRAYVFHENVRAPSLHCFDTQTLAWTRLATRGDVPRCGGSQRAFAVNGTMYVFQTRELSAWHEDHGRLPRVIYALDLRTLVWRARRGFWPQNCCPDGCVAVGDRLYVLLMQFGKNIEGLFVTYLDTGTDAWVTPPRSSPAIRNKYQQDVRPNSLFVYADCIYATLVRRRGWVLDFLLRYSIQRNEWEQLCMNLPNDLYCVAVVDSRVYFTSFFPQRLSVLDMLPSLRTLCLSAVSLLGLDTSQLPATLQRDVENHKWRSGDMFSLIR